VLEKSSNCKTQIIPFPRKDICFSDFEAPNPRKTVESVPHLQGIVHRLKAHRRLRQFAPAKVGHHLERPAQRHSASGEGGLIWLEPPKKSMEIQWEMAGNHKK